MKAYRWEETGTDTLATSSRLVYTWDLFFSDFLEEELNIVEFHVEKIVWGQNSWGLVVGVCCDGHNKEKALGSSDVQSRECMGWGFVGNGCKNHNNSAGSGIPYSPPVKLKDGDQVRMVYNKPAGTISFELNEVDLGEAFNNVSGKVRIAASSACNFLRLKISRSTSSGIILDKLTFEENERLDFILRNLGEVEVPLRNKTITLWKPFLRFRNSSIKDLQNYSLAVEERIIFCLLLSKNIETRREFIVDYFMFYKILSIKCKNMKHQIFNVLTQTNTLDFLDLFFCLKDISTRFENESVRSWFTNTQKKKEEEEEEVYRIFRHSFTLWVFNRMKYKLQGFDRESERFKNLCERYEYMTSIIEKLDRYRNVKKVLGSVDRHPDFGDVNNIDHLRRSSFKRMNLILWKTKKYSNAVLKTVDGGNFEVHIEFLVWKFNFFHKMIQFGGKESNSFKENGSIFMEQWEKPELHSLLEFGYTDDVTTRDLRILTLLFIHGEKFKEGSLKVKMLEYLAQCIEFSSAKDVKNLVTEFGYLLHFDEILKEEEEKEDGESKILDKSVSQCLIPLIMKKMGKKELKKLIERSDEKMEVQIVILNLQRKVQEQDEAIRTQSSEILEMKETMSQNQKDIEMLKNLVGIKKE